MIRPVVFAVGGVKELLLVNITLPYIVREDVGDLMREETPGWFDRILCGIESSALFVWFMRRRFRGLKARRWGHVGATSCAHPVARGTGV